MISHIFYVLMPGTCLVSWSFCGSVMRRFLFCNHPFLNKEIVAEISSVVLQSFCIKHTHDTIIGRYWISTFTCNRDSEIWQKMEETNYRYIFTAWFWLLPVQKQFSYLNVTMNIIVDDKSRRFFTAKFLRRSCTTKHDLCSSLSLTVLHL